MVGIGGTAASVIAGTSPWKTPLQLYYEMRGELPVQQRSSEVMEWGNLLEDPIARKYAKETGRKIRRKKKLVHSEFSFIVGSPDREILSNGDGRGTGILEVKTANSFKRKTWQLEGIPANYYIQVQHYLLASGYKWAAVAVLFGGQEFTYFEIPRDQATITELLRAECAFWQMLQDGEPPDPTHGAMGSDLARCLWPESEKAEPRILSDNETAGKLRAYFAIKQSIKEREARLEELQSYFQFQMQESETAMVPGVGKITWSRGQSSRFNAKDFKKAHPDIHAKFLAPVSSSRFSCKSTMDEKLAEDPEPLSLSERGIQRTARAIDLE